MNDPRSIDEGRMVRLTNGTVEVVVSAAFGPRILRYAFVGEGNVLGEFPDTSVDTAFGTWRAHGGHRLWVAPEADPQSYAPDDLPVEVRFEGALNVRLTAPTDRAGFAKELVVGLMPEGTEVTVRHRLTNRMAEAQEAAIWALTIFDGGKAIVPLEPFRSHGEALSPTGPLVLWPFTDLTDARLTLGPRQIEVSTSPGSDRPQKIGLLNRMGSASYEKGALRFTKRYEYAEGERYPDYGVNTEVFVKENFLELETLGPLRRLGPGETAEHLERWTLDRL